mgnify:CR=1 FL=1
MIFPRNFRSTSILASILVLISPALIRVVMIRQVRMSMTAFLVGFLLRALRLVIVVGAIDGAGVRVDRIDNIVSNLF